jgi:hypothetical protein
LRERVRVLREVDAVAVRVELAKFGVDPIPFEGENAALEPPKARAELATLRPQCSCIKVNAVSWQM